MHIRLRGSKDRTMLMSKGASQSKFVSQGGIHGSQPHVCTDQTENFHDVSNNVLNAFEVSETDGIFEDAPLHFDHAYPLMDRWTRNQPKEQVLGDPQIVGLCHYHFE